MFSHFLLIMYDAYLHLSSENNLSYDSAKKVVHVLTLSVTKTHKLAQKGSNYYLKDSPLFAAKNRRWRRSLQAAKRKPIVLMTR